LSKLRVSFEYLFAGPSIQVFGNQNMVILLKRGAEARPGPKVLCSRRAVVCFSAVEEEESSSANQRSAHWCLVPCSSASANQRSAYWSWAATDKLFSRTHCLGIKTQGA